MIEQFISIFMLIKYFLIFYLVISVEGNDKSFNGIQFKSPITEIKIENKINNNLWPYPQSSVFGRKFFTIDSTNFKFITLTKNKCHLLDRAITRYQKLSFIQDCSLVSDRGLIPLFDDRKNFDDVNHIRQLFNITIQVMNECETKPYLNMNEKYSIHINDSIALIFADSVWGAMYGLETFSQLLQNVGLNQFIINTTSIVDYPRFSHRGLMLDTSRHYISMRKLVENLDAMVYNKLNVFHWHIVDDQSFPYVSRKFPDLSEKGAYNPKTHIYSPEDIAYIIEYARDRGIRVLPEFDTPGHTDSWGKGQPGLLTSCYSGDKPNGLFGPIDPMKNTTYDFIEQLFSEVTNTFTDQYMHLGGDEVEFSCWQTNPNIIDFMKQINIGNDFKKLEEYYMKKVLDIVQSLNRSYIVWQEIFDDRVDIKSDTIVHIWKSGWQEEMSDVTKSGYQSLLSSCWYLNYISYGSNWQQYYRCDPHNFDGSEEQKKLVIGGEACMWGMKY